MSTKVTSDGVEIANLRKTPRGRPKVNPREKASVYIAFRVTPAQAALARSVLVKHGETLNQATKRVFLRALTRITGL